MKKTFERLLCAVMIMMMLVTIMPMGMIKASAADKTTWLWPIQNAAIGGVTGNSRYGYRTAP